MHQVKSIFWYFNYVNISGARFIWTAWILDIILLKKQKHPTMCFKNGKKLHINNCLAYQLISLEINLSLGSYLCEKNLANIKKISEQIIFRI